MRYIVIDLEATCWERGTRPDNMETIEIGAVELASSQGPVGRTFNAFVKPLARPALSEFCRRLTSIRQEDVDRGATFPEALERLRAWIGPPPLVLCSWGAYDLRQLQADCARHGVEFPREFARHLNLKGAYSRQRQVAPTGMARALRDEGLSLRGTHHRGLDDARNIAQLALRILPWLESVPEGLPPEPGSPRATSPSS